MRTHIIIVATSMTLAACANRDLPCEEILEVKEQERQCQEWRRVMNDNRYPQQALTARKNYEKACQDLRYYRNQFDTICKGDETPIGHRQKD